MGRDSLRALLPARPRYFNPPSPCGEGLVLAADAFANTRISILPPRVGRDMHVDVLMTYAGTFQSSLPVWGGTFMSVNIFPAILFQSSLPVWGGTAFEMGFLQFRFISILPPRVGRDPMCNHYATLLVEFQSSLPVWGGTAM